jgi:hypothetical protein
MNLDRAADPEQQSKLPSDQWNVEQGLLWTLKDMPEAP